MHDNDNCTNYGLRNIISPSQNSPLTSVENNIYDMVRNMELRQVRSDFQDKLKEDINEVRSSKNLFVFVDKLTNLYELWDTDHNRLLMMMLYYVLHMPKWRHGFGIQFVDSA